MKFYVRSMRGSTSSYSIHEGMSQQTVVLLLTELEAADITFVTEEEYQANAPRP